MGFYLNQNVAALNYASGLLPLCDKTYDKERLQHANLVLSVRISCNFYSKDSVFKKERKSFVFVLSSARKLR